jgi:tetratricopeptide (TPR) repeat protein
VALAAGHAERAVELAEIAIERAEAAQGSKATVDAWTTLARARLALGRTDEALEAFGRAAELARVHGSAPRVREVLRAWADALAGAGRHAEAYAIAREALAADEPAPDQVPQRSPLPSA